MYTNFNNELKYKRELQAKLTGLSQRSFEAVTVVCGLQPNQLWGVEFEMILKYINGRITSEKLIAILCLASRTTVTSACGTL